MTLADTLLPQGLGASLRDRAGGLRPQPLRVFAVPALIACAVLGGCGDMQPPTIECVNIVSHERLTNTDMRTPDEPFSFSGTDRFGFRRFIASEDRKWWKCRRIAGDGR